VSGDSALQYYHMNVDKIIATLLFLKFEAETQQTLDYYRLCSILRKFEWGIIVKQILIDNDLVV
jgi:hypothetical protein